MQGSFIAPGPATSIPADTKDDKSLAPTSTSLKELFNERILKVNLGCSIMIWLLGSFNFYLITFYLKSFPGNIYINSMCFAGADLIAYMSSGFVLKFLTISKGLFFSYSLSLVGGLTYLLNYQTESTWLIPVLVCFSRIGGSMSFNIGYVSVARLFPTNFVTTVFGIVNFVSHGITVGAPMVAELGEPIPFVVFCCNAAFAIVFGLQLVELDRAKKVKIEREKKYRDKKMKNFITKEKNLIKNTV